MTPVLEDVRTLRVALAPGARFRKADFDVVVSAAVELYCGNAKRRKQLTR